MSYDKEREDIESRFFDAMAAADGDFNQIQLAFDNFPMDVDAVSEFIRFSILNGSQEQASIGAAASQYRNTGIISIGIFTGAADVTGSKRARQVADVVAAIFRGKVFGNPPIICRGASITNIGPDGKFYHIDVSIPFQRDEVFTTN